MLFVINVSDDYRNRTTFYLYNATDKVDEANYTRTGSGNYTFNHTFIDMNTSTYYINVTHIDKYDNLGSSSTITATNNFIDNCSTASMQTINFTIINSSNSEPIVGTGDFLFTYNLTDQDGNTLSKNYSSEMTAANHTFCLYPNESIFTSDIDIDYTVGSNTYSYFVYQLGLSNVTQAISLYTQDSTDLVTFTVTDFSDDPIEGAYIKVLQWDIGKNEFKTVELLKTNSEGKALGNMILYTTWYKFVIDYNGVTYLMTEPEKLSATTRTFRITFTTNWFNNYDEEIDTTTTLTFNNVTNNVLYTWTTPTSTSRTGCLKVIRRNVTRDEVMVDNCTTSTAGSRLYNIPVLNGTYIAQGYLEIGGATFVTDVLDIVFPTGWKLHEEDRTYTLFISFMLTAALMFVGIFTPITSIVLLLVGLIASIALGFYNLAVFPVGMALIVMGGILIWKLSRR